MRNTSFGSKLNSGRTAPQLCWCPEHPSTVLGMRRITHSLRLLSWQQRACKVASAVFSSIVNIVWRRSKWWNRTCLKSEIIDIGQHKLCRHKVTQSDTKWHEVTKLSDQLKIRGELQGLLWRDLLSMDDFLGRKGIAALRLRRVSMSRHLGNRARETQETRETHPRSFDDFLGKEHIFFDTWGSQQSQEQVFVEGRTNQIIPLTFQATAHTGSTPHIPFFPFLSFPVHNVGDNTQIVSNRLN